MDSDDEEELLLCALLIAEEKKSRRIWVDTSSSDWFDNVFPTLNPRRFKERFHFSKEGFQYLVNRVGPFIYRQDTNYRDAVPVVKRVAVALFYLGSSCEYRVVADQFGIGTSTALDS